PLALSRQLNHHRYGFDGGPEGRLAGGGTQPRRCAMWAVSCPVLVSYLAVVTVLMFTPGPDMLFVLASGIRGGSKAGFVAAVGVAVGEAGHLVAPAARRAAGG